MDDSPFYTIFTMWGLETSLWSNYTSQADNEVVQPVLERLNSKIRSHYCSSVKFPDNISANILLPVVNAPIVHKPLQDIQILLLLTINKKIIWNI